MVNPPLYTTNIGERAGTFSHPGWVGVLGGGGGGGGWTYIIVYSLIWKKWSLLQNIGLIFLSNCFSLHVTGIFLKCPIYFTQWFLPLVVVGKGKGIQKSWYVNTFTCFLMFHLRSWAHMYGWSIQTPVSA